jgi:hypothetical protein
VFGGNGYMEDWPMARQLRDAQCHTIWEGTENICAIDVRRAMRADGAHEAVLDRIDRVLKTADEAAAGEVLAPVVAGVRAARDDVAEACRYVLDAPEDLALLQLRRLAYLMADTLEGALACEEAVWALASTGDARKAAVARRFVTRRLVDQPIRGITSTDRTVIDLFEPIVRYGAIEPKDVLSAAR